MRRKWTKRKLMMLKETLFAEKEKINTKHYALTLIFMLYLIIFPAKYLINKTHTHIISLGSFILPAQVLC